MRDLQLLLAERGQFKFSAQLAGKDFTLWCPVGNFERWNRIIQTYPNLSLSVFSRAGASETPLEACSAFWAMVESGKALARLESFVRPPTLILRHPTSAVKAVAFWALDRALTSDWIEEGNRRLARAFDCPRKYADPFFEFDPHWEAEWHKDLPIYQARSVVGFLPKAPSPDAWRERKAA